MEAKLGDSIFKAYDIRGVYPSELDESTAEALGCSFGEYIGRGKTIAMCRDVRLSSNALREHMLKGLSSSELKILDIGIAPTPVIYFAVTYYGLDGGAMITASHNPKQWNGFKFYGRKSEGIGMENGLSIIKDTSRRNSSCPEKPLSITDQSTRTLQDYESFLLGKVTIEKGLKIGIDPGNGSYSSLAKRVLEKAGAQVYAINDTPDGNFPARSPEPTDESLVELKKLVVERSLAFGIGFDADGDRGVFVDDKGRVIRGDTAFAIFVRNLLKPGEKAIYDVSCTDAVEEEIKKKGGIPIVTRVGRTYKLAAMVQEKAAMAGELSAHMFFSDVYGSDDALFAGLKMAHIVSERKKSLSELLGELTHYESAAIELSIDDKLKPNVIDGIRESFSKEGKKVIALDGVKIVGEKGWFILRASNTTPVIRLIAEARTKADLKEIVASAKQRFEEVKKASPT